jgi:pimeloyl-ACP methyl ester carboxylesterase
MHGDRAPALGFDPDAFVDPGSFVDLFAHSARDVARVVAQLRADETIGNVGLRGGSVGGFIVLSAIGVGADARAVLSVCGGADWANTFMRPDNYVPTDQTLRLVAETDPIFHLDRFPPKPVLLIHGLYDDVVPIVGHRHLYDALAPAYRERPEDCLFITHAGAHPTPMTLEEFGWTWLIEQIR